MKEYRFSLFPEAINTFPLSDNANCFYITGTYRVLSDSNQVLGTANFQTWINSPGTGPGMLVVDLRPRRLFFFQIRYSFSDSILRIEDMGFAGGYSNKCDRREYFERGFVDFSPTTEGRVICVVTAFYPQPNNSENIAFYQNMILKDAAIFTNTIETGNPASVYRVGGFKIYDTVTDTVVGDNFFQNYPSNDNQRGIGLSVYITPNLTFYSMLSLLFSGPISDSTSTVEIDAITPAGQKFVRNFLEGVDSSVLVDDKYLETISGTMKKTSADKDIVIPCFLTNGVINIFQLQPGEPKSTVRLLSLDIVRNLQDETPIGKTITQTYVTSQNNGIGSAIFSLNLPGMTGTIFCLSSVSQNDPLTPARYVFHGATSGDGDFKNLEYGFVESERIPETNDFRNRIVIKLSS